MYLVALDVSHDGKEDVAAAWSYVACCPEQQNSGTINFINNGDGSISTANLTGGPDFSAQGTPVALTVLDLVGNGTDTVALERGQGQLNPGTSEPGEPPASATEPVPRHFHCPLTSLVASCPATSMAMASTKSP